MKRDFDGEDRDDLTTDKESHWKGRRDLLEARRASSLLAKYITCDKCPNSPGNGGTCKGVCPGLDLRLDSEVSDFNSIRQSRPSDRRSNQIDYEDGIEHTRASTASHVDLDARIMEELLRGALPLEDIADMYYVSIEEVDRLKEKMLGVVEAPIVRAIIEDRIIGAEAMRRFRKHKQEISRQKRAARRLLSLPNPRAYRPLGKDEGMKEANRAAIDGVLLKDIEALSLKVGLSVPDTVSRMLIRYLAENDAQRCGLTVEDNCLFEFYFEDGKPIDMPLAYRLIRRSIEARERHAWEERTRLIAAAGAELDAEQVAYIEGEKRAAEMRRHEVLNRKQDALACERARIDYPWIPAAFPDDQLAQWLELMRKGKATMEQVRTSIEGWKGENEGRR